MDSINISYGLNVLKPAVKTVTLEQVIKTIRTNKTLAAKIKAVRDAPDKKTKSEKKKLLPFFSGATFKKDYCNNANFEHITVIVFDFDDLGSELSSTFDQLIKLPFILAVFVSPSGDGLKVICRLPKLVKSAEVYLQYWHEYSSFFRDQYKLENDRGTKDVRRICYLSADPDAYYNPAAKAMYSFDPAKARDFDRPGKLLADSNKQAQIEYDGDASDSDLLSAAKHLSNRSWEYSDWVKAGMALASLGASGLNYFLAMSDNANYDDSQQSLVDTFNGFLKTKNGSVHISTFFHFAINTGWDRPKANFPAADALAKSKSIERKKTKVSADPIKFWTYDSKKNIVINQSTITAFLEHFGFRKLFVNELVFSFVQVQNKIVRQVTPVLIKDFVLDWLDDQDAILDELKAMRDGEPVTINIWNTAVKDVLLAKAGLFREDKLEFLRTEDIKFVKDSKHKAFIFFKNRFVEITKTGSKIKDYKDLKGCVWASRVEDRNITADAGNSGDFEQFCVNVASGGNATKRLESLRSMAGYLLHKYKDPTDARAVIFIDAAISDMGQASGGTGKSLFCEALGKMVSTHSQDARNFKFGNQFGFQNVQPGLGLFIFNDANPTFPFGKMFSMITDGMMTEKKNKDAVVLSFDLSPKFMITTNYIIGGIDASSQRRQAIFEFADFYSVEHRPIDEFGKAFFNDWDADDWNSFDWFMISCIQYYLANGIIDAGVVNLRYKKLRAEIGSSFADWILDQWRLAMIDMADAGFARIGGKLKDMKLSYIETFGEAKKATPNYMNTILKRFAKIYGLEYVDVRTGTHREFYVSGTIQDESFIMSLGETKTGEVANNNQEQIPF